MSLSEAYRLRTSTLRNRPLSSSALRMRASVSAVNGCAGLDGGQTQHLGVGRGVVAVHADLDDARSASERAGAGGLREPDGDGYRGDRGHRIFAFVVASR